MIGSAPDTVCRKEPQLLKVAALILQGQIVPLSEKMLLIYSNAEDLQEYA